MDKPIELDPTALLGLSLLSKVSGKQAGEKNPSEENARLLSKIGDEVWINLSTMRGSK